MTSFASEMPGSPGHVPVYENYNKPYSNPYEDQKEQLSAVQKENNRLKTNLTRVQTEYEELQDESNYQRAKVSELTELVAASSSQSTSFPQPNHTPDESHEYADATIRKSLIEKSLENAELTLYVDRLRIERHNAEARLADLELQKRANSKLLLEMGDVIRTLNSVNIEYTAFTPQGENISTQQQSIKNIKLKVEAILKDRRILIQNCNELNELAKAQEQKIMALEAQFHFVNTTNISHSVALNEIAVQRNVDQTTISLAASSMSDDSLVSQQSIVVNKQAADVETTDAAASEIVRQSQEIAKHKKRGEVQAKQVEDLERSQKTQNDTISRLEAENERLNTQLHRVKKSLVVTKGLLKDAAIKRDEFKDNLKDIISHYKDLQADHEKSDDQIGKLQCMVVQLESKVRETQAKQAKQAEEQLRRKKTVEIQDSKGKNEETTVDCKMGDLLVAYAKAQKRIEVLQDSLMKQELGHSQYQKTSVMFKKLERERNDFQRKLNQALEETRLAKQQAQKEKDESRQVRRQLRAMMQNRDDETASLESESGATRRSTSSSKSRSRSRQSRSRSSHQSRSSSRSRSSSNKKALVKKASFKPLTVEELMKKDFAEVSTN